MIAETSREAFYNLKHLGTRQQQVYDAVQALGCASNDMIVQHAGLPINVVTARVNELVKMGYLGLEKIARNTLGNRAKFWSVRELNDKQLKEVANEQHGQAVYVGLDY